MKKTKKNYHTNGSLLGLITHCDRTVWLLWGEYKEIEEDEDENAEEEEQEDDNDEEKDQAKKAPSYRYSS